MNYSDNIKVAVVDDSFLVRDYLQGVLNDWGYDIVLEAVNGMDLFRQLTPDNAPDICITDLHMPEMNGYETVRRLKEQWPAIRTILYSAADSSDETEMIRQAGPDAFVSKLDAHAVLRNTLQQLSDATAVH